VIDLTECLDIGWISSGFVEDRMQWFQDRKPWSSNWSWAAECVSKFLDAVRRDEDRLVWLAPHSAQELSGFLWYLHETRVPPKQMIVADYPLEGSWRGEPPRSLGELGVEPMGQLFDGAPRLEWDRSQFPLEAWRSLMDDGAVLRVVEGDTLRSVRPDHYDEWILGWCPPSWTKWHRVLGDALGRADQPIDYLFIQWRLEEMIGSGAIECDGQLPDWDQPSTNEPAKIRRA